MSEEELRKAIVDLVNSINSKGLLEYFYRFISAAVTKWK